MTTGAAPQTDRAAQAQDRRDHGGGVDGAVAQYGGTRSDWLDLSTGINPDPYPVEGALRSCPQDAWTALPDRAAQDALTAAARAFWNVPDSAAILAAPGASSLIARLPNLWPQGTAEIQRPTYNEHAAAFEASGWQLHTAETAGIQVAVHPNNPDGRLWRSKEFTAPLTIIDESFCDVTPDLSHIARTHSNDTIVLKSFGKFWGLAGLRLGFAIGAPELIDRLATMIGPWAVSGPALEIGARALQDHTWAEQTRVRLAQDSARLDGLMQNHGATCLGGTTLFRLYEVGSAAAWQDHLAQNHVWSRIFPYSKTWLRLGLPAQDRWSQLERALEGAPTS